MAEFAADLVAPLEAIVAKAMTAAMAGLEPGVI